MHIRCNESQDRDDVGLQIKVHQKLYLYNLNIEAQQQWLLVCTFSCKTQMLEILLFFIKKSLIKKILMTHVRIRTHL